MSSRRRKNAEDTASQQGLGLAIERLRRDGGLTKAAVAKKGGLTTDAITAIESGDQEPTWSNLRRIAKGLSVELEELCAQAVELAPGQAGSRIRRLEKEARQRRDKQLREAEGRQA